MIFFISGLYCMDTKLLVNGGLINADIPKDIYRIIQSYSTLQSIGRLKRVNKGSDNCYENENCSCSPGHLSFTCQELKKDPYVRCTKVLAHYAEKRNKQMFLHMWLWKRALCNYDVQLTMGENISSWTLEDKMAHYCHYYNSPEKQDKVYCKQIINALRFPTDHKRNVLKITLKDSGFNIYESPYRKKSAKMTSLCNDRFYYTRRWLFNRTNLRQDIDFFLAIIGGAIQPNMLKSLFKYLQSDMVKTLDDQGLFPLGEDKHGKSAIYYYKKRKNIDYHKRERAKKGGYPKQLIK